MKIVISPEESRLSIKGVSKTMKNEAKKGGFPGMLLGALGASFLVNLLKGKGKVGAGKGTVIAGQNFY